MNLLSVKEVCLKIKKGRTKLWQMSRDGTFPGPIKIDSGIAYIEHEVENWIKARIDERDQKAARS